MNDFGGKIAIVTGASRGLGRRIAVRLSQHGAMLALLARNEAGLEQTRQEIATGERAPWLYPSISETPNPSREPRT